MTDRPVNDKQHSVVEFEQLRLKMASKSNSTASHSHVSTQWWKGTVLGGTYPSGNASPVFDERHLTESWAAISLESQALRVADLHTARHVVGFQPSRTGWLRVETERIGSTFKIYTYGHFGVRYLYSYGCAHDIVALVKTFGTVLDMLTLL